MKPIGGPWKARIPIAIGGRPYGGPCTGKKFPQPPERPEARFDACVGTALAN
jgi:hypothetical protein